MGEGVAGCGVGRNGYGGLFVLQQHHHSGRDGGSGGGGTQADASGTSGTSGTSGSVSRAGGGTIRDCTPNLSCKPDPPTLSVPEDDCVARINQFRACACKPPLTEDSADSWCAEKQAAYDAVEGADTGMTRYPCSPTVLAQNVWSSDSVQASIVDGIQQMFDEGPPPEVCDDACYRAHRHFINLTDDYHWVACGFAADPNLQLWAVQNFR